jgi:ATP-dependent phosphofructokinase / diphosphate-dependent phosphofructokinase
MGSDIKRVGMLFSGGPAPAANAVISGAALSFLNAGIEVIGFLDGYQNLEGYSDRTPLVEGEHYLRLTPADVSGIRTRSDIILRTARANPGKAIKAMEDLGDPEKGAKLRTVFDALDALGVDALISLGGDDTLKTANFIHAMQERIPELRRVAVVHLPKTIDNDYYGIDWTFGFNSAATTAGVEVRTLAADAKSMSGWYVVEVMGRKAGWLTYAAGMAGGAVRMLSVEDFDSVFDADAVAEELVDLMLAREAEGKRHGVICLAEGLADMLPDEQRPTEMDEHGNPCLRSVQVGQHLAGAMERAYERRTGKKARFRDKQIGYETRCVEPGAFDIMLGSQLGVGAYRALVEERLSGVMVSIEGQLQLRYVPFGDLIDPGTLKTKIRMIDRDSDFFRLARALEYRPAVKPGG